LYFSFPPVSSGELVQETGSNSKKVPASLVGSWMVETGGDQDQASMMLPLLLIFWNENC
jgi:hypothetical protein